MTTPAVASRFWPRESIATLATPVVRIVPLAALIGSAWAMAWIQHGSIAAGDWLGYAVLGAFVAATVLLSGGAARPDRVGFTALSFIIALACWAGLSSLWSPVPSLARDEALLTMLYAIAFAIPLLTLRSGADRFAALALLVAGMASLALATGLRLRFGANTLDFFESGRLATPISYTNAQAAMYLIAFWPAILLASRRRTHVLVRSLSVGGATAMLAGWLLAQSKGAAIALVVSAVALYAVFPARLRILVPTLIPVGLVGIGFNALTAPYRSETDVEQLHAIRDGGMTLLWLAALGFGVGLIYVLVDRRVSVSQRLHRAAGAAAIAALIAGIVVGVAAFFVTVDRPGHFFEEQWNALKKRPGDDVRSTHLLTLGSDRYDFWRVALSEFRDHPLVGDGARAFGPLYLQKRAGPESPARTHSLPLEALMEGGIVGLLLLSGAVGVPLWIALRRARTRRGPAAAAFGGAVYWFVHAGGDWIWTFPAAGIPLFCLLAIGAAPDEASVLRRRKARPAAAGAIAVALLGFAPVWISAKLTSRGAETGSASDLRWAQRLDPLSVEPLIVKASLASTPQARIPPLEEAVDKQPRSAALRFLVGEAYLEAGRREDAVEALEEARRLDPREPLIQKALNRARQRG